MWAEEAELAAVSEAIDYLYISLSFNFLFLKK